MYKFDFDISCWSLVEENTVKKEDKLPFIDSHSMVCYSQGEHTFFYMLCGFVGGKKGSDSSCVYSYN